MELLAGSDVTVIIRLSVATLLGLIIGAERSRVGKLAGMRTYALVSLGAALFVLISSIVTVFYAGRYALDPLRIASQIVVGIGFLGAGVIFVQRQELTGLTTAAGLWVAAGIGTACGYGLYLIASYVTFLTLFIFEIMWYIEEHFVKKARIDMKSNLPTHSQNKPSHHHENEG